MTDNRQAALRAAIEVWSVEQEDEEWCVRPGIDRILHLAHQFEVWLNRPDAARLVLVPGNIRPIPTE